MPVPFGVNGCPGAVRVAVVPVTAPSPHTGDNAAEPSEEGFVPPQRRLVPPLWPARRPDSMVHVRPSTDRVVTRHLGDARGERQSAMNPHRLAFWLVVASVGASHGIATPSQDAGRAFRIVPTLSQASYAVDEVFLNENNRLFTAVGVSRAVSGTITVNPRQPSQSRVDEIVVDLRHLQSDSDRRDRALREKYLDTGRFPVARLANGVIGGMPATIVPGRAIPCTITGDLTVHGTTRRTLWRGEASFAGDTLRAVARTEVKMSHFGIEVPRLLSLRSDDDVKLEIRVVAVAGLTSDVLLPGHPGPLPSTFRTHR